MADHSSQLMQCMEVWGGNQAVDSAVAIAGLDAWVFSRPFGKANEGGDVYYVSSCATGRITRLLIADVSGHGSAVGDVAGQLRLLMRQYVNFLDQRRFVQSMNRQFLDLSQNGCFATALVTTFFAPTNHLSICNAGHPPPLLYRGAMKKWTFLENIRRERDEPSNIPLGIEGMTQYEQFDVRLSVGDWVMCYTDSFIECRRHSGELLGGAGLLQIVRGLDATDPVAFIPALIAAISRETCDNLAGDDLTVLLFRPNGLFMRVPLLDRLLAPMRVIRGLVRSFRGREPMPWPEMSLPNIGGAMIQPLNRLWGRRRATQFDEPSKPTP